MTTHPMTGQHTLPTPAESEELKAIECVRFGCAQVVAWIVTDPAEPAGLLRHRPGRRAQRRTGQRPPHSSTRIEIYRP